MLKGRQVKGQVKHADIEACWHSVWTSVPGEISDWPFLIPYCIEDCTDSRAGSTGTPRPGTDTRKGISVTIGRSKHIWEESPSDPGKMILKDSRTGGNSLLFEWGRASTAHPRTRLGTDRDGMKSGAEEKMRLEVDLGRKRV